MKPVWIALAGGCGALLRYGIGVWLAPCQAPFGWGTVVVNVIGCLLMGVLVGLPQQRISAELQQMLGIGFLGGLTTYSAFNAELVSLLPSARAAMYAAVMIASCVGAGLLGQALGRSA